MTSGDTFGCHGGGGARDAAQSPAVPRMDPSTPDSVPVWGTLVPEAAFSRLRYNAI